MLFFYKKFISVENSFFREQFSFFSTFRYATRVGTGPFPSEQGPHDGCGSAISKPEMEITNASTPDQVGEWLQRKGFEYGTTTKRARRCGWIDLVALRYAHRINHFTENTDKKS